MKRASLLLLPILLPGFILSQIITPQTSTAKPAQSIPQEVVVDEVAKNLAAEKAGLREGDILLHWARGDETGEIGSPFDVMMLGINEAPRGPVSLKGWRGSEEQVWTLGPGPWGLKVRSDMPANVLSTYLEGRELARAGKWAEAAKHWQAAASQVDKSTPTCLWLLYQAAFGFSRERQWTEVDENLQRALGQAGEAKPVIRGLLYRGWASSYKERSDWVNAEKYHQLSMAEDEKAGAESLLVAADKNDLGVIARLRGDPGTAEKYHREALQIRQRLAPGSLEVAGSLNNVGLLAWQRRDLLKAEDYLRQAVEIKQKWMPESLDVAGSLNNLGLVAFERRDLARAEEYHRRALEIQRKLAPESLDVAASLSNLGSLAWQRGDLVKAQQYWRDALEMGQKLAPGSLDVAFYLSGLGGVASQQGDLAKAEDYHLQALAIRQKLAPSTLDVASTFDNLGNIAWARGDLAKAEDYDRQALDLKQKLAPGSLDVAGSFDNLGIVLLQRGDLVNAEQYFHQALDLKRKLAPGSRDVAGSINNLGNVAWQRGDLAKAEQCFQQALEIGQQVAPGSLDVAEAFNNLAAVADERGDTAKAERYDQQALAIRQRVAPDSLDVVSSLENLGTMASKRGDLAKAEEYHLQALKMGQRLAPGSRYVAASLDGLGSVAWKRGDLVKAEYYRRGALDVRQKLGPQSREYAGSLAAMALILRKKEQLDEAAKLYQQAVDVLEKQLTIFGGSEEIRSDFRSKHLEMYREYIDLLLKQKQPESAFQILERSRARGMLETLAAAHVNIRKGVDPFLVQEEHSLEESIRAKSDRQMRMLGKKRNEAQMANLEREINDLLTQYDEVEGRIRSTSPTYAHLTQPQILDTQHVQQLLDADTVLLEYLLGGEQSHVFVVSSSSLVVYELPKRIEIETAARQVSKLLTEWDKSCVGASPGKRRECRLNLQQALGDLSQMILGPISGQIQEKRLLIVSDGALEYIPFAALPSPGATSSQKGGRKAIPVPLMVDHEIVNLPSASVLAEVRRQMRGRGKAPKAVVVLADPVFDKKDERVRLAKMSRHYPPAPAKFAVTAAPVDVSVSNELLTRSMSDAGMRLRGGETYLPRLPFTRREAQQILAVTPAGQGKAALDFNASRATMLGAELREYRIVHIATHGLVDSTNPELSGLVLSLVDEQGESQYGFLGLQDIYNLDLGADLVVLSACQTGLGKQVAGEGLLGMTRGFMYAGASQVVASLWNEDDPATAELMGSFYRAMEEERMPPSAALRHAEVQMWKQKRWTDAYYWAGFQIQGEWKQ